MTDAETEPERLDDRVLIPFAEARDLRQGLPVTFNRRELDLILRLYSLMVGAGEWRDYAIDHLRDRAVFSAFRRASEMPMFRIEKNPQLARRQGEYAVVAASGLVMKRGHDLARVLSVFDKMLVKARSR